MSFLIPRRIIVCNLRFSVRSLIVCGLGVVLYLYGLSAMRRRDDWDFSIRDWTVSGIGLALIAWGNWGNWTRPIRFRNVVASQRRE